MPVVVLLIVMLGSFASGALAAPMPDAVNAIRQSGLQIEAGRGSMNGVDFPAYAIQASGDTIEALAAKVKQSLERGNGEANGPRYTVTQDVAEQGIVLTVWDFGVTRTHGSSLTPDVMQRLFDTAITMTIFPLPDGGTIGIASPAGVLLRAASARGKYAGSVARSLASDWRIDLQSSFVFGRARQHSHVVWSPRDRRQVDAELQSALAADGFEPLTKARAEGRPVGAGAVDFDRAFVRGNKVFGYAVQDHPGGGTTLSLYESVAGP